ncbi:hypothetical protein BI364_11730 [Acidihalobacter yilgarnensis]|uniref:AsmA domain-containing protein n=1 Tax=Acidihalobacter yilgarnensis TaxID=2819280 RepID=A0A1D8IQ11_9GAMM|nr:hypothetical protein [Acidihalobacter yilgarnensis]AOU98537.1 hypothetical protein BI364_11730 [Acidihalobacter yilgarnensis]
MKRWLSKLIYGGLLSFVILSALVYMLIGTPTGTRWLLDTAAHFSHGRLTITASQGSLIAGLRIDDLRWHSPDLDINVAHAILRWRPLDLLAGRLHIDTIAVTHVLVIHRPGLAPAQSSPSTLPLLPLPVRIANLRIHDLIVVNRTGPT